MWIKAGITHMFHVIEKGTFLPRDTLCNKIGRSGAFDFEYNALFNGISKDWKQLLLQCNYDDMNLNCIKESFHNHNSLLRFLDMKNSEMRDIIGENTSSSICGKMFWMRKYNFDISNHYIIANKSTKESRLRLLHFKILHNIFPSNILLNRMGIKDSERCDYCGEIDVIEHMYPSERFLEYGLQ